MKKRTGEPWMAAPDYGRAIARGLGLNLLVVEVAPSCEFARSVLGAETVYEDADIGVLRALGSEWLVHADHTYDAHPLRGIAAADHGRGAGAELRLYGLDPDAAEAAARAAGHIVLAGAHDKPHGLREAYLIDPDGYVWVPSVPCAD